MRILGAWRFSNYSLCVRSSVRWCTRVCLHEEGKVCNGQSWLKWVLCQCPLQSNVARGPEILGFPLAHWSTSVVQNALPIFISCLRLCFPPHVSDLIHCTQNTQENLDTSAGTWGLWFAPGKNFSLSSTNENKLSSHPYLHVVQHPIPGKNSQALENSRPKSGLGFYQAFLWVTALPPFVPKLQYSQNLSKGNIFIPSTICLLHSLLILAVFCQLDTNPDITGKTKS